MRNTIINTIFEEAKKNPQIILLTADFGYSVTEKFVAELPKQFFNVGIAEQNMIGIAAGLALSGKKVFVFTAVPFVTMRCFEQIRVDVCCGNLDVTMIGIGGGYAYGTHGNSHYAIEDLAIMRSLPNMKVFCPADPMETQAVGFEVVNSKGPAYIRLNRGGEKNIFEREISSINVKEPIKILEGDGTNIVFATGNILDEAYKAITNLTQKKEEISLYSTPLLKPIDKNKILDIIGRAKNVFTIEEHNIIGGLGSSIAEIMAENSSGAKLIRLGVEDKYFDFVGKQDYMRDAADISADKIEKIIMKYV